MSPPRPTLPTDPHSPGPAVSELTIVVDDGTGTTTTWTLTCDPVGGDHPEAERACSAIDASPEALNPVPQDRICAQVYGGPERAVITGAWRGQPVAARLARTDACEIARWDALVPLVPPGGQ